MVVLQPVTNRFVREHRMTVIRVGGLVNKDNNNQDKTVWRTARVRISPNSGTCRA